MLVSDVERANKSRLVVAAFAQCLQVFGVQHDAAIVEPRVPGIVIEFGLDIEQKSRVVSM